MSEDKMRTGRLLSGQSSSDQDHSSELQQPRTWCEPGRLLIILECVSQRWRPQRKLARVANQWASSSGRDLGSASKLENDGGRHMTPTSDLCMHKHQCTYAPSHLYPHTCKHTYTQTDIPYKSTPLRKKWWPFHVINTAMCTVSTHRN